MQVAAKNASEAPSEFYTPEKGNYPFEINPVSPFSGAEIIGVDVSKPLDQETVDEIYRALLEYHVLVFRDQKLNKDEQGNFAKNYGELEWHVGRLSNGKRYPVINNITNVDVDGKLRPEAVNRGPYFWHTDKSYHDKPSAITMLHAIEIPSNGGDTEFANMKRAYEVLSSEIKELIGGLKVQHSWEANRRNVREKPATEQAKKERPPVTHPMVRTHPDTGEKALYIGTHIDFIHGMEPKESALFVEKMLNHGLQEQFRYNHKWRKGDLVMWDNRSLMHRGSFAYELAKEKRVLQRTVIIGTVPF